jgi:hypothetical protein
VDAARAGPGAAGLAGGGAVPGCPALWANAGEAASVNAMAMMVILGMGNVPGMRRWRVRYINSFWLVKPNETGAELIQDQFRKCSR